MGLVVELLLLDTPWQLPVPVFPPIWFTNCAKMTRNLDLAQLVLAVVKALPFFLRKFNLKKEENVPVFIKKNSWTKKKKKKKKKKSVFFKKKKTRRKKKKKKKKKKS